VQVESGKRKKGEKTGGRRGNSGGGAKEGRRKASPIGKETDRSNPG